MDFVPEPHLTSEVLQVRADGCFGPVDCFQWPQLYVSQWGFSVCISHQENHPDSQSLRWAWYMPTPDVIRESPGTPQGYGFLKDEKVLGLDSLSYVASKRHAPWKAKCTDKSDVATTWLKDLQHTIVVLRIQPLPFIDVLGWFAFAQRTFLDIYSFMEYVEIVQPRLALPTIVPYPVCKHWMGCFTYDTALCNDFFLAGIPVWLVRTRYSITHHTIIKNPVKYTFPDAICRAPYSELGKPSIPYLCLYRGSSGLEHHNHTWSRYVAFSASVQASSHVGKTPTHAQMKKQLRNGIEVPKGGPLNSKHGTCYIPVPGALT